MRLIKLFLVFLLLFIILPSIKVKAVGCEQKDCSQVGENDKSACLGSNIQCLTQKISETKSQSVTLRNTITILESQAGVLQLQIDKSLHDISILEGEIQLLEGKIELLDQDLDKLVEQLLVRVVEQYKQRFTSPISILFSFSSLSTKSSNLYYIKLTQQQVANSMKMAEDQRIEFDNQKRLKHEKQVELETARLKLRNQRLDLEAKQKIQEDLLMETSNNEARFQNQLASEQAEFLAIQAICSGQGNETEIRHVSAGEKIATLINGESCNSDGTHLHFSVREKSISPITNKDEYFCKNPFNYLKKDIAYYNCSTRLGCGHPESDPFVPSGSWEWPLSQAIYFFQGFGSTWAVKNVDWLPYEFHNGLDLLGQGLDVKSVQAGTLYHGFYTGTGGCKLQYAMVRHENTSVDSLYLHVNY